MPISEVVQVNITRETKAVTQRGFGIPLILGNHTKWPGIKQEHTIVFDADLITANSIDGDIDGVAITTVPFNTDNATTLDDLVTELELNAKVFSAVSNGTDTVTVTTVEYDTLTLTSFLVTGGATQAGIVVTETVEQQDEIRSYTTLEDVSDDFSTSDEEFKKAEALFSQTLKPEVIKIGRRRTPISQVVNITVPTVVDNTDYTATINGIDFTFDSGVAATAASIVDGLIAAISGGSEPVTPTDNGDDFDLTADIPGQSFSIQVTTNLAFTTLTPNQGMASDILKAQQVDDDWYFLIITTTLELDITEAAKTIEALFKLFFTKLNDPDVKNGVANNIAELLKAKSYDRTCDIFLNTAADQPEAAWVGGQAPKDPGSITWAFKQLSGVTIDNLSSTEISNLDLNSVNYYTELGGIGVTRQGTVVSGEFIDIIRGTDWIQSRIEENVFSALVNEDKIPFTNAGIDVIKSKIKQILLEAVNRGILVDEPDRPLVVSAPDISEISQQDKSQRLLQNVTFEGFYAGAIHKVKIEGFLSV